MTEVACDKDSMITNGSVYSLNITARMRSTREGAVFTGVCLLTFRGGTPSSWLRGYPIRGPGKGVPHPAGGGTPSQFQVWDTPSSWWGVPHPRSRWWVVPHPRSRWEGTPSQVWMGGTPSQVQAGGAPFQVWMDWYPISGLGGGYPPYPGLDGIPSPLIRRQQHSEHLLCSGWYASCVHAGGLSCSSLFFVETYSSLVTVKIFVELKGSSSATPAEKCSL